VKLAVVLFNLGGPDSLAAVQPFLQNLFSDPAIIQLPSFLRRPLAKFIAAKRAPLAKKIYEHLGGSSPILPETEAQARALRIPNTAMAVTTDLVDDVNDIHPVRKREVGERLAACALARDYGRDVPYAGPTLRDVEFRRGGEAAVTFDNANGLRSRDGQPLTEFTVAGADGAFVPAEARIAAGQVIVSSPRVAAPKFVRFGWAEEAMPNLVNGADLPACPFRTDDFPPAATVPATQPVAAP